MTKIIGFSGRKQSGKNTSGNFVFGLGMMEITQIVNGTELGLVDYFKIHPKTGELIIPAEFNGKVQEAVFNPLNRDMGAQLWLSDNVWPHVKMYSFADTLKSILIDVLDVPIESCYGTNEQKNQPIQHIKWYNLPGIPHNHKLKKLREMGFDLPDNWTADDPVIGRHLNQYVGTDIFRKIFNDCWVLSLMKRIKSDKPDIAIVIDVRFPNEADIIQKKNDGIVIRFTRAPFAGINEHKSEKALDDYENFTAVIDNEKMSIDEQNEKVYEVVTNQSIITQALTTPTAP